MSSSQSPHSQSTSDASAERRRLEAEMLMYQSDRAKLLRKKEALDVEKRTLQQKITALQNELDLKEEEEKKLVVEIQGMENELLRLKRHMNSL